MSDHNLSVTLAPHRGAHGFTLLEMCFVLLIVALILGGVMVGRSLIAQAQLRAAVSELRGFSAAVLQFRGKYAAYPGDFRNATRFWGRADGGADVTANCANPDTDQSASNAEATCNGNGDGSIARGNYTVMNTEVFRLWQHLANDGLIPGSYSGVGGPVGGINWRIATVGVNVPKSPLKSGGYYITSSSLAESCGTPEWTGAGASDVTLSVKLGAQTPQEPGTGGLPWVGLASADELAQLDVKYDDGMPGTGALLASCPDINCTVGTDTQTATYQTNDRKTCRIQMNLE